MGLILMRLFTVNELAYNGALPIRKCVYPTLLLEMLELFAPAFLFFLFSSARQFGFEQFWICLELSWRVYPKPLFAYYVNFGLQQGWVFGLKTSYTLTRLTPQTRLIYAKLGSYTGLFGLVAPSACKRLCKL